MTSDLDLLPDGVRELAERRDALLGTLEASTLKLGVSSPVMLIHVDADSGSISEFGLASITQGRAVLRAFADPPDPLSEAAIIGDLIEAMKARRLLEHGWLRIERVLRPETKSLSPDTVAAYTRLGFEFFYTEHELERDLRDLPDAGTPDGIAIVSWTRERDLEIRQAYNDAFRDRGFAGFDEQDWAGQTFSAQDAFRAGLSFLALDRGTLAGFVLCEDADEAGMGWIDTVGVRPPYRTRGLGAALTVRAMLAMRAAGLEHAGLRVNQNNARARRLYDRLGFTLVKKHVVYTKRIGETRTPSS